MTESISLKPCHGGQVRITKSSLHPGRYQVECDAECKETFDAPQEAAGVWNTRPEPNTGNEFDPVTLERLAEHFESFGSPEAAEVIRLTIRYIQISGLAATAKNLIVALQQQIERAIHIIQAYQPSGSPPPGDWPILLQWVLMEKAKEIEQLQHANGNAFVAGAKWWEFHKTGGTMFPSDTDQVEQEAARRGYEFRHIDEKIYAAEIERLKAWVNDLQSGMYINCVYCGHQYGPKESTPVSMADILKAHVEKCPKHPMSKLKVENEQLTVEVARLRDQDNYLAAQIEKLTGRGSLTYHRPPV